MPHRLNTNLSTVPTIKELRGLIAASDAYDMDNVYFTEEGWVYRHYKKADKSVWWDEIISAGQVDVADSDNDPVIKTVSAAPTRVNLGTTVEASITFETGDGKKDYTYGGNSDTSTPPAPPAPPTPTGGATTLTASGNSTLKVGDQNGVATTAQTGSGTGLTVYYKAQSGIAINGAVVD